MMDATPVRLESPPLNEGANTGGFSDASMLERRATYIRMSSALGEMISTILDPETLLVEACDAIQKSFGYFLVGIWIFDEKNEWLELRTSAGPGIEFLRQGPFRLASDADTGIIAKACRDGRPCLVNDISREAAYRAPEFRECSIGSELVLPMSVAGMLIGALDIESEEKNAFSEEDLIAMQSLGTQIAVASRNAELYETEQRRRRESESLREASAALNESLDREEVLRRIIRGLSRVLEIDSASIMLSEGGRVGFVSTSGINEDKIDLSYPPLEELFYVRKILETNEPIIIRDTHADPHWYHTPGNDYIRSWLGVPLVVKGHAIGLLTLDNKKPDFFTQHHALLASSFASQASIAIENAQLYKEEARRRKEAETLRDVTSAINASLDPDRTLHLILEELAKVLEYDSASIMQKKGERIQIVAARWPDGRFGLYDDTDFSMLPNVRRAMASAVPILIKETRDDPIWQSLRFDGDEYIRCWIGIPFRIEGETIGLLNVDHHQPGFYGAHELELAVSFANHAAIAIQNARLYAMSRLEIEDRKQAEARTLKANAEKLGFLSDLVAVIAHEVNTPTGVAITAASHLHLVLDQVRKEYGAGTLDEDEFLAAIEQSAETVGILQTNLQRIAELIRTFRKIAVDQEIDEKRSFNVKEYIEATLLSLKPRLKGLPHNVKFSCPADLVADATPGVFYQIVVNLISNSLAHAFPEGRSGNIELAIAARESRMDIVYRDDGIGILPENLPLIFKPFFTTARSRGGTGLGLYIVDNLVAKLGGSVSCSSEAGKGVCFRIEIPNVVVHGGISDE